MVTILLHSSKTMRADLSDTNGGVHAPALIKKAATLARYVQGLSSAQLASGMQLSPTLAKKTHELWQHWTPETDRTAPAIDCFLGDIYSGLQVSTMSDEDRDYAHRHLLILSGLYGGLHALDGVSPYRLEMGYHLPDEPYHNLYTFWGSDIAVLIPPGSTVVNLSAVEYTKAVLPHLPRSQPVITPKFLTRHPATGLPGFVTVHAKIARGAFANWLIRQRITDPAELTRFSEIGYRYDSTLSSLDTPTFVCDSFGGLGLSVRKASLSKQ